MSNKILIANNICKSFHDPITVQVLNNISFSIEKGEFISVIGKSGCGKFHPINAPINKAIIISNILNLLLLWY